MAIPADFQEREYESLFIQEVTHLGGFTWSPGQTDENLLGFDAGMWLAPHFLLRFGFRPGSSDERRFIECVVDWLHPYWPWWDYPLYRGKVLSKEFLPQWGKFANECFPKRALNFFAQHKRPYQSTEQGAAGDYWKSAYFQFRIDQNQQRRLEELEHRLGKASVVTYSCAAFMKKKDLWDFANRKEIIKNSNFVSPGKLSGHSRYTFTEPGHVGFANAEPTPIADNPIISKLQEAAGAERTEASFTQLVKVAGNAVSNVMAEEDRETGDGALFSQLTGRMHEQFGISESDEEGGVELLRAITNVMAFNTINSTSWAIVSPPETFEE